MTKNKRDAVELVGRKEDISCPVHGTLTVPAFVTKACKPANLAAARSCAKIHLTTIHTHASSIATTKIHTSTIAARSTSHYLTLSKTRRRLPLLRRPTLQRRLHPSKGPRRVSLLHDYLYHYSDKHYWQAFYFHRCCYVAFF